MCYPPCALLVHIDSAPVRLFSPVDRIERAMQGAGGERVLILAAGVALGSALTYLLVRRTRRPVAHERAEPSTAEPERSSWRPVGEKPVLGSRHMLRRLRRRDQKIDSENGVYYNRADAPDWCQGLFSDSSQRCAFARPVLRPTLRPAILLTLIPPLSAAQKSAASRVGG